MEIKKGSIKQVLGPVIDVSFNDQFIPSIKSAIYFDLDGEQQVAEVALHLGDGLIRCIAMGSTEGLARGIEVTTKNLPIMAPVGEQVLGRMFNVTGEPIDGKGGEFEEYQPIHREAPA